jgi:DNA-binding transcriptional LysR family regulator
LLGSRKAAPVTLKQLEAFYWAATSANFTMAAQRLHVSQSSLSKRISELEQQIGKPLFDRSGHRSLLTEAGELLLPLARNLLGSADGIRTLFTDSHALRGICRFGVGELGATTWLPKLVARARNAYPELLLESHVDVGESLEERVDQGELDFAVVAGLSRRGSLAGKIIAEVGYAWVGSPALVAENTRVTRDTLRSFAVITMPGGAGPTRIFEAWLALNDIEVGRRLTCNNLSAIAGLVSAGVGIGFLPEAWLRPLVERGSLVELDSDSPFPVLQYALQWRRDDTRPRVKKLLQLVGEEVDFDMPNPLWSAS